MTPPLVLAIFGPTAAGKTALAVALADRLPCHLISCDALQVYRGFNVATEKPVGPERRHPWALIDCADPREDFDLGRYVRAAEAELQLAAESGRLPVLVGGTGMYLRGVLKGLAVAPRRDPKLRARLEGLMERHGVSGLHRILLRLDPQTGARLQPRDKQRIVRALEVRLAAGESLAALQADRWSGQDRFPTIRIGLRPPRAELHRRIDARIARYVEGGLVEEVEGLLSAGVPPSANAFRALGYRQVLAFLQGKGDASREGEMWAEIARQTRQYAKRQLTWFRSESDSIWLDPSAAEPLPHVIEAIDRRGGPLAASRSL